MKKKQPKKWKMSNNSKQLYSNKHKSYTEITLSTDRINQIILSAIQEFNAKNTPIREDFDATDRGPVNRFV